MSRLAVRAACVAALLSILSVVSLTSSASNRASRPATPPYRITAIKAMLFYEQKGTFSDDILADKNIALWNTIIGEGSAGSPSNSTLVMVEVTGKKDAEAPTTARKVELMATDSKKVVLKRAYDISLLEESGKFYAPFWLYDTGCNHIKLTARIIGQTQPSTMTRTIPFECGE